MGTFWGFGGVWGSIMNDNDGLEEELGEVRRAEPAFDALRRQMQKALVDTKLIEVKKKRIADDAATKK